MTPAKWDEVAEQGPWSTLLIGNGASMAVWSKFGYGTLFQVASDPTAAVRLLDAELRLFRRLRTRNFEEVLDALLTFAHVGKALRATRADRKSALSGYDVIRAALASAVSAVHIPWETAKRTIVTPPSLGVPIPVDRPVFSQTAKALRRHTRIFSTNYDLLLYWSILEGGARTEFVDFFFSPDPSGRSDDRWFDPGNTEVFGDKSRVYYLHGGLHLYRRPDGTCLKRVSSNGSLLDAFVATRSRWTVPLFVSEGTEREKRRAIGRSRYLSFCYEALAEPTDGVVIFGHGLGSMDRHLAAALSASARAQRARGRKLRVALSCLPPHDAVGLAARRATLANELGLASVDDVLLFDSTTHPMGDPTLRCG